MTKPARDNASSTIEPDRQFGANKPQCVQEFVNTLLPDEKQLFDATILAKTLVDELKRTSADHKETSSSRRFGEACLAFISGVELYGKGLDVFANGSDILCPLWGGVRVVFELAKEFGEYFIKLGDMLENIGLVLTRLPRFPELYPDNAEIKTCMVDIYDAIFEFCAKVRHVFRVGKDKSRGIRKLTNNVSFATALRVLWKPFSVDFDGIRDRIAKNVDNIEAEADIAEKEIAGQERRTDQARWAAAERSQRLLADFLDDQSISLVNLWLAPANVEANHKAASFLRHDNSGSWFLEGDTFQSWLTQDNSFLWLYAIPGAGKTVLVSSIINQIHQDLQSEDVGLAYFYCDYKDSQKQDPAKLLATVLVSLAQQSQGVFDNLQAFFLEQSAGLPTYTADFDTLVENFPKFVQGQFRIIFMIVDAMDETNPSSWDDLAHGLRSLHDQCSELKILVTSRNELPISRAFHDLPRTSIEQSDVVSDIRNFIRAELSNRIAERKLKLRNPELQDAIRESLAEGSRGMFQWVRCQIEALCKLRNDNAIRAALFNLPRTLQDTYHRILQRIEDRHPDDVETFHRVLSWLVRGVRDLTLDELAEAISIDPESNQDSMDFGAVDTDPEDILGILGGLVVVSTEKIVSLAHYSVKEFLVSEEVRTAKPTFWIGSHDVERDLAAVCLSYLCYDDFKKPLLPDTDAFEDRLNEYKFLAYATMAWPAHVKASVKEDCPAQNVVDLTMRLFSSTKGVRKNYWSWEEVNRRRKIDDLSWKYQRPPPLICAAWHGLSDAIRRLLAEENASNSTAAAFEIAALNGHIVTVEVFLEHHRRLTVETDGSTDQRLSSGSTLNLERALCTAASHGHDGIVEKLLREGADAGARAIKDRNALHAAALEGHAQIINLLLQHGANHSVPCKRYGTPLAAAAERGHLKAVEVLLESGAHVNGRGGWYSSPLVSAIMGHNTDIIELMVENGADIQPVSGRHRHPVWAAASQGMGDLVRDLVSRGASIKGSEALGSALACAASFGHVGTINTILKLAHNSDQNYTSSNIADALVAAALGDHVEAVKCLAQELDHVDMLGLMPSSGLTCTPLEAAASGGHIATVKLLLEMGADPTFTNEEAFGTALVASVDEINPSLDVVEALLDAGCDPNVVVAECCKSIGFPLYLATRSNRTDIVQLLLANNADVNLQSGSLHTALQEAIWQENVEIIDLLLEHHADVNIVIEPFANWRNEMPMGGPGYDVTALQSAAWKGSEQVVHRLVARGAQLSVGVDDLPFTSALQIAAYCGHLSTLKALIEYGSDVEKSGGLYFGTPLECAAYSGHVDCARVLLLAGADVNKTGTGKWINPLTAACWPASVTTEMVSLLAENGANVNARGKDRLPFALHTACNSEADTKIIELLLDLGADVNAIGGAFGTALQVASYRGSYDTVALLLRRGADPNIRAGTYNTALQAAYEAGHPKVIDLLYEHGALNTFVGGKSGSVMGAAISNWRNGNNATVDGIRQLVTKHGFDVNLQYGKFGNALQHSIHLLCVDAFDCILAAGADVNKVNGCSGTALTAAAYQGNTHMLEALLSRGAQLNLGNSLLPNAAFGAILGNEDKILQQLIAGGADVVNPVSVLGTSLQVASIYCGLRIVKTLVRTGAPINTPPCGRHGSPLQAMIASRDDVGARYLLHRGADISARGGRFGSPLHAAAIKGTADMVDLLLQKGADPNIKGGLYCTPLQAAAVNGRVGIAVLLLNRGADVNATGGRYHTALQAACISGSWRLVELLVERGADVNARGGKYQTPLSAAAICNWSWAVRYLLGKGAEWSLVDRKIAKYKQRLDNADDILQKAREPEVEAQDGSAVEAQGEPESVVDDEDAYEPEAKDESELEVRDVSEPEDEDEEWDDSEWEDSEWDDEGSVDDEEGEEDDEDGEEDEQESDGAEEEEVEEEEKEGPLLLNVESIPGFDAPWRKPSRWDRVRENLSYAPVVRDMLSLKLSVDVPPRGEDEDEVRSARAEVIFEELRMMQLGGGRG
ncbi:ankyrin repeat-containing domain protein [Podospora conica]|nr:ankyrin repeat-containing domain protein [Schizothecium conicum]